MAHPFLSEKNFETGDYTAFDTETDVSVFLNIRNYDWLARMRRPMPYRGAYSAELDFSIKAAATNPAYFAETGDLDTQLAANGEAYVKFYLYCPSSPTWTMANNDTFQILGLYAGATSETSIGIIYTTAAGYRLYVDGGTATTYYGLTFDKWLCIEAFIVIDNGVGNDGATTVYVDGVSAMTTVTADQGAITEYRYGCIGPDAGTTSGVYYLGPIVFDDARLYPNAERFPWNMLVSATQQIFVGPGCIESASLLTVNSDDVVKIYDTDLGSTAIDEGSYKISLSTTTHTSFDGPLQFLKGAYAVLSGTAPRCQVNLLQSSEKPGLRGPIYYSDGGMRRYGILR